MGLLLMWHEIHEEPSELNVSVGFFFDALDDSMDYMGLGPYAILIGLVYSESNIRMLDVLIT